MKNANSERPNIRGKWIIAIFTQHFRGDESWSSDNPFVGILCIRLSDERNPKISDLHRTIARLQKVFWFQVHVCDSRHVVKVIQTLNYVSDVGQQSIFFHWDHVVPREDRTSTSKFQHQEKLVGLRIIDDLEELQHIWMLQLFQHGDLLPHRRLGDGCIAVRGLDRIQEVVGGVQAEHDFGVNTAAEVLDDDVLIELFVLLLPHLHG
mmetsp:Transcript_3015/g.11216  ORF Transcript_3015/g.11216 Transcript_3015/m.11216 type:complete len:207 (+) Transcript_3015:4021-4641(+)